MNINVREASEKDIAAIVEVHINAFENYFTTSLGKKFLYQFYRLFLDKEKCCLMVASDQNNIIAFIAGIKNGYNMATLFKRNAHHFIVPLLLQSLNIKLGYQLVKKSLTLLKFGRVNQMPIDLDKYHEIMSFAVLSQWQGKGVGKYFYKSYESLLIKNCLEDGICLTTDTDGSALVFYQKQGYKIAYSYRQKKTRNMCLLLKKLVAD